MEKRFKVWVYKEGEPPLFHRGPQKNIYSSEGQFIDEMESPDQKFAAPHPDEAHAFFIPVSITNIVHYVYDPSHRDFGRERIQDLVEDYIKVVANKYPYWNRSGGADHFYVACHDWGPFATQANPKLFKNLIRVLCNANVSEGFIPTRDVTFPEVKVPPVNLNPPDFNRSKSTLAFFAGGAHGYIREVLLHHWKGKDSDMQVHEYLPKHVSYFEMMSRAKFCLCPSGYEVASPRLVESMHMGCVPVVISDAYPLPLGDVLDWTKFSVQLPVEKIPEMKKILEAIPMEEYLRKQREVWKVKKHFVLHRPSQPFDVFRMVIHSVWLRRLNVRLMQL
ncbi:hypothetical protein ACS0TY_022428 [Phlomoides rotata]